MALSLVYEAMPAVVDQSDRFAPLLERLAELVRSVAGQTGGMIALSAQTAGTTNGQLEHLMEVGRLSREAAEASERNRQLVQATAEQVSRAAVTCGQGGESISRFVGELRRVAAGVAEANGLLAEVLRAATEVRKTVAVVGDLAAQTNLLALNASIEAAHAGEKGAGFAIVAKEVRELAGRSRQAAEQIAGLVQAMGTHTEVAVRAVGQTATAVDQSVGDAERLEQQLSELAGEMRTAREQSEQVSEAAAGQIQTLAAIGERGAEVQEACRACAAAADGAAEASTSVMASAADLGDLANELAELTGLATPETGLSAYRNEQGRQAATAAIVERARAALAAAADRAGPAVLGPAVELGTARVPDLLFGRNPQANATALVDATSGSHGCSATLFVRDGDDFVRLSTSVRRGDGSRAVGTKLNGRGIAAPHLRRGEPYVGPVFILGQAFHAAYDPIRDSSGRVVGARYVGRKLAEA